ncbi:peptidoglycan-binding domain-containing protein [Streptomyces beigongshangae]|uniref:peptidoglycan-binding domain-containing protein n=1 Tax=Streptomyces beigongshangae TaxID=2841597 RepID=UPI001C842BCB|nr:peptidoglycan-binding domain-containing protein [Streptomyces sp. REN17]
MSTPFDPEEPTRRAPLEPTHVLRRQQQSSLSELLRQVRERERDPDEGYEVVAVPVAEDTTSATVTVTVTEDDTGEPPPVAADDDRPVRRPVRRERRTAHAPAHGRSSSLRRTTLAVTAVTAAVAGFGAALLLTRDGDTAGTAQALPPAASSAPPASAAVPQGADPDGPGTLREGDSGPAVSDLQERLLRIPNVYDRGTLSGVYDATLTAAVARFQLWYGIRGDETGVYGDDTRNDLEARTAS